MFKVSIPRLIDFSEWHIFTSLSKLHQNAVGGRLVCVFSCVCRGGSAEICTEFFLMRSVLSFLYPQMVTVVEGVCVCASVCVLISFCVFGGVKSGSGCGDR